jgi:hypothetical protein
MNMILTRIVVYLVQKIGFHTNSEVFSNSSIMIFFMTFLNTAVVILLGNADVREGFAPLGFLMHGKYNDYS